MLSQSNRELRRPNHVNEDFRSGARDGGKKLGQQADTGGEGGSQARKSGRVPRASRGASTGEIGNVVIRPPRLLITYRSTYSCPFSLSFPFWTSAPICPGRPFHFRLVSGLVALVSAAKVLFVIDCGSTLRLESQPIRTRDPVELPIRWKELGPPSFQAVLYRFCDREEWGPPCVRNVSTVLLRRGAYSLPST